MKGWSNQSAQYRAHYQTVALVTAIKLSLEISQAMSVWVLGAQATSLMMPPKEVFG